MIDDKPYYELNNAEFLLFLNNLIKVVTDHRDELQITQEEIDELIAIRDAYEAKLSAQITAEEMAQAKTRDLTDYRKIGNQKVSFYNTDFKNNKSIPRELVVQMGFRLSEGKTSPPPSEPTNLMVTAKVNGEHDLKWNRNGNKQNTIFVVEEQTEGSDDWKYVTSVSGTKCTCTGQTPGVQIAYRVTATRKNQSSPPSNIAVVYYKG